MFELNISWLSKYCSNNWLFNCFKRAFSIDH